MKDSWPKSLSLVLASEGQNDSFESKYIPEPNSGCWLYVNSGKNGYGIIKIKNKTLSAHRYSYLLHRGDIPLGMDVCHSCDMRSCVNPDHLFLGTRSDNMQDAKRKGRLKIPGPECLRKNRFRQEDKKECPQGHPYNEENTYYYLDEKCTHRQCKKCRILAKIRYKKKIAELRYV